MSAHDSVVVEIDHPIAYVWLNRPDKLNGVDRDMLHGLIQAAESIRANRDIRGVILSGRGRSFCAGLDFASVFQNQVQVFKGFIPNPFNGQNLYQRALWIWRELPVPVVAVVNGHCYGAGAQLAAAADFRFTAPDSQWSIMEAKWGLVPDMSGTAAFRGNVRDDVLRRLTMTGEVFDGTAAVEYGMATETGQEPLKLAIDLLDRIIDRSPDSVAGSKELLNRTRHSSVRRAFALERRIQFAMLRSANTKIARAANLKKQMPRFKPRTYGR